MIKFNIREGFWGLGKSFDIAHSQAIKLPPTFSKDIAEGRFFIQQFVIAFANAGILKGISQDQENVVEIDRSPYWMHLLSIFDMIPNDTLFFGAKRTNAEIKNMVFDLVVYWDRFQLDMIANNPITINYKVYKPRDIEQYAEWLKIQFASPSWRNSKLIASAYRDISINNIIRLINEGNEKLENWITGLKNPRITFEYVESKRNFEL